MLAQQTQMSKQYDFFDDKTSLERDNDFPSEGETENKLKDIKKDYEDPAYETAIEFEEKTKKYHQEFFETGQKINKIGFEASKDKEIKDIVETIDDGVKGPMHPRDRRKRKLKKKDKPEFTKQVPIHPRYRLKRQINREKKS